MKKNALLICLLVSILVSCSTSKVHLNKFEKNIKIHTSEQDEYLSDHYENITRYAIGDQELSRPMPLNLSWEFSHKEDVRYEVNISENPQLYDSLIYETNKSTLEVYNLKIGTKYYWQVTAYDAQKTYTSEIESFYVEEFGPRNLYVDGITNVRDIGGWPIDDSHRVKQGLLFRSGRLNSFDSLKQEIKEITSKGEKVLLEDLKIKSEMDLRELDTLGNTSSSVLGSNINYFSCPMEWNGNILELNIEMVKKIFSEVLTDETNYPMIFHCNIGTDRTGMITYLLNGLLGVSQENLYKDYLFSNFGLIGGMRTLGNIKNNYVATIEDTQGDNLSTRISNYLISIGVKKEQLNAIKNMFIEEF